MSHRKEKGRIIMDENKALWKKCVEFHGHECGGLTIGYKAALYAIERMGLQLGGGGNAGCLSPDEEIVCISENDACGVDAIQAILGCSVGKGNLLCLCFAYVSAFDIGGVDRGVLRHVAGRQLPLFLRRQTILVGEAGRVVGKPFAVAHGVFIRDVHDGMPLRAGLERM